MKKYRKIVDAVKHSHKFGGNGSAWALYYAHNMSYYRQMEWTPSHDQRVMSGGIYKKFAMRKSTIGG